MAKANQEANANQQAKAGGKRKTPTQKALAAVKLDLGRAWVDAPWKTEEEAEEAAMYSVQHFLDYYHLSLDGPSSYKLWDLALDITFTKIGSKKYKAAAAKITGNAQAT